MSLHLAVSAADVDAAARRIEGHVVRTPAAESETLAAVTGARCIVVKFENLQFTASFKERGARNRLALLTAAERTRGVIAISAGNHAQGVARHAALLGIPATIVMPAITPFGKIEHTAAFGAEVVLEGDDLDAAAAAADRIRAERDLVPVHPYDDPAVIAGQGTVGLELLDQADDLDAVLVPVGGGGLVAGIATVVAERRPGCRVIGVQTVAYPSMVDAIAGRPPSEPASVTLAEGIAVKRAGRLTTPIVDALVDEMVLVDEDAIERAVALLVEIEKTVVEGAGAVGLAALLTRPDLCDGRRVALVLSGGNIDSRLLASVLERNLVRDGRVAQLRILVEDRPGQLARVTEALASAGANVIEIHHQRMALDLPVRRATVDVVCETRDRRHLDAVVAAVAAAGITIEVATDAPAPP